MSKRTFWTTALMVMAGVAFPLYAQEPAPAAARLEIIKWSMIAASFPLGIAAAFGALGQGKAIAAAAEAIARNPERDRRHPWRVDPGPRPDRVPCHLRAADLADPVLPAAVRQGLPGAPSRAIGCRAGAWGQG